MMTVTADMTTARMTRRIVTMTPRGNTECEWYARHNTIEAF